MSDAYDREQYASLSSSPQTSSPVTALLTTKPRQNNSRLDELSSKVSALRGVTVNIYDNARDQNVIDNSVRPFPLPFLPLPPTPLKHPN